MVELRPGKIGTLGIRPVVAAPAAQPKGAAGHLGISPDGRFLFRAAAGALTVTDTAAPSGATGVAPSGELAVGAAVGPFWLSPDATVLVFRSGQVVRVSYPDGLAPKPVREPIGEGVAILYGWHTVAAALAHPRRTIRKIFATENAAHRLTSEGFTLPFARWMNGELAPLVHDGLQRLADGGWVTREAPDRVWSDWQRGASHWTRPWGLSVLGHFLAPVA